MKKWIIAAVASAATVTSASAADLPARMYTKAPMLSPAPIANWSGFYAGVQIGYQTSNDDHTVSAYAPNGVFFAGPFAFSENGVIGGGHFGLQQQFGQFVIGAEADLEGSGVKGTANVPPPLGPGLFASSQRWQASLRGRLGMLVNPTLMLYATGGVAWGGFEATATNLAAPVTSETWRDTLVGWTFGAGAEWAFAPAWTARAEYRYTDFGKFVGNSVIVAPGGSYRTADYDFHTFRLGASYHFSNGPIVAKY